MPDADSAAGPPRLPALEALESCFASEGAVTLPALLSAADCGEVRAWYAEPTRFRKRIVMQQHGYGQGEYQYFAAPLPAPVQGLRETLYAALAPLANRWMEALREPLRYPPAHAEFLARCHACGQRRPTPLLLRYGRGDYNCLHQDLYGAVLFPLQAVVLLSRPGDDFAGGELILTEQRARAQAVPRVVPLAQGDAAIIAARDRPAPGLRHPVRVRVRHGVSRITRGERLALGIIFHDAE